MVTRIYAGKEKIKFVCDGQDGPVKVRIYSPAIGERVLLGEIEAVINEGAFEIGRYLTGRDGAFLRYEASCGGTVFCTDVESRFDEPYPEAVSVKGLQVSDPEDAAKLGVRHTAINVAINDIMRQKPGEGLEPFVFDGKTYYINMKAVRKYDETFRKFTELGIFVTLILLCGKRWNDYIPEDMKPLLLHPDYDDEGTLSAFNVVTDEGIGWYQAFLSFLAERYMRPDGGNGRVLGMIISNEVTSQWIWGNAGEKTVTEYAELYTQSMRMAYIAAKKVCSSARIYCSMDHFWGRSMDPSQPKRFYGGLELLNEIRKAAKRDGDFYYNIAHHPYPEDLTKPDFWNDTTATPDPDTIRITFKNLEVLADFIRKEENFFDGRRRRIILSEQGFNSKWTPESEILQATAYGRAYRKVMEIPEIDAFILHAHRDNKEEFGLNLGVWRRKKDSNELDAPKPIYYLMKAIDTVDDTGKYVWERF